MGTIVYSYSFFGFFPWRPSLGRRVYLIGMLDRAVLFKPYIDRSYKPYKPYINLALYKPYKDPKPHKPYISPKVLNPVKP